MDERTAEDVLYLDATLVEIADLATRGRAAYDADLAVARACQYNAVTVHAPSLHSALRDEIAQARSLIANT